MNPWLCNLLFNNSGGSSLPATGQTFYASLKTSLVPEVGTGGPTWSRSTAAWRLNEQGYLRQIPSGCAEFCGARLVRNKLHDISTAAPSEDLSGAGWTRDGGVTTPNATTIVCANASGVTHRVRTASSLVAYANTVICMSGRFTYVDHEFFQFRLYGQNSPWGFFNLNLRTGEMYTDGVGVSSYGSILVSENTYDFWAKFICPVDLVSNVTYLVQFVDSLTAARGAFFAGDGIKSCKLTKMSMVDVTGKDSAYIPEYVSVGVLSAPYHGAGTDGAKYFKTDWQGAPIPAANLLGFRRESSAINNLLYCRDLSNAAWSTKTNITAAKTATGLDGIANSATTLTATAADAIILQPITLASAARCASAYVERRTGTGTISFTQDGGSTWTDITSLINSSTWSRVQITSTLANPSVGFKLGTSGDAIDVDCVKNEAGAVATSPIVTTTATISRAAESLTYQTASNWSDTAGTSYILANPVVYSGGAVGSATNGLLLSTSNSGATSYDGTNTANGPTGTPGDTEKLAVAWGSSAMSVASSGAIGTAGTYDGAMGLSSIGIGVGAVGYFGDVAIYNYKMSDAELQAITA